MPFKNVVRLPFFLSQPQYPADEEVYLKGNGRRVVLNSAINKELEGKTDWLPKEWHERFSIALRHDDVTITSQQFTGMFRISGSYEIEWQDFLNYPLAPAKFKGFEDGFSARSNLCNVCAETSQLELADDFINVVQGEDYSVNTAANDFIACGDPVFEIAYTNSDYIASASINGAGVVSLTMKPEVVSASQIVLVTYRVTCGAESATANIVGGVTGTAPGCPQPVNVVFEMDEYDDVPVQLTVSWDMPDPAPTRYYWYLERVSDGAVISNGYTDLLNVVINALDFSAAYKLRLNGVCQPDPNVYEELSIPVVVSFTTPQKPSDTIEHEDNNVNIAMVNDGSGIKMTASFGVAIPVLDNVFITGTLTAYTPFYSARTFDITISSGDVSGETGYIFSSSEATTATISNVSVYPASSKALTENKIMDFIIVY